MKNDTQNIDTQTVATVDTHHLAVKEMEGCVGGEIRTYDTTHRIRTVLVIPTFNAWASEQYGVDTSDKPAMRKLRKREGINAEYRNARKNMTAQIAAVESKATSDGLQANRMSVSVCKKTGKVLAASKSYNQPKTPSTRGGTPQSELEAVIVRLKAQLAMAEVPAIDVTEG